MSKQRAVRAVPPRTAGVPYGQLALQHMFDQHGRLIVEHNLVTVQALLILQSHEMMISWPWTATTRYQGQPSISYLLYSFSVLAGCLFLILAIPFVRYVDLALKILEEDLKVHEQNYPILTPVPTPEFVFAAIDRECARRAFWLIRFMHLTAFTFYYVPIPPKPLNLSLRLPVDETSFELGVHSTLSGTSLQKFASVLSRNVYLLLDRYPLTHPTLNIRVLTCARTKNTVRLRVRSSHPDCTYQMEYRDHVQRLVWSVVLFGVLVV